VTLLASIPATVEAACCSVTAVDETDGDTDAEVDVDGDGDVDDEAATDADAVAALAATEVVGAAVLVELAASLIVSWWLNGWSSSTVTTTATANAADRIDQNNGARDRRPPFPGGTG
jgi:hypothetical protein